jgi:hypothetical protein
MSFAPNLQARLASKTKQKLQACIIKDPSFGYPEHSNWQRVIWQCSNFIGFTHPTKQTNKTKHAASCAQKNNGMENHPGMFGR